MKTQIERMQHEMNECLALCFFSFFTQAVQQKTPIEWRSEKKKRRQVVPTFKAGTRPPIEAQRKSPVKFF